MSGEAPNRRVDAEILLELPRPEHLAITRVKTQQVAFGAEGIELAIVPNGTGAWPRRVTHIVSAIVFMFPNDASVLFVEAQHSLGSGDRSAGRRFAAGCLAV